LTARQRAVGKVPQGSLPRHGLVHARRRTCAVGKGAVKGGVGGDGELPLHRQLTLAKQDQALLGGEVAKSPPILPLSWSASGCEVRAGRPIVVCFQGHTSRFGR